MDNDTMKPYTFTQIYLGSSKIPPTVMVEGFAGASIVHQTKDEFDELISLFKKKGFKINLSIQPGLVEPEPRRFDITPSSGGDYAI
jgi:hypothetical protein